jgi:hypothetical protein
MICSFVPADGLWLLGRARPQKFRNTFELAKVINGFIETIVLDCYAIYIFDDGAPMGRRPAGVSSS